MSHVKVIHERVSHSCISLYIVAKKFVAANQPRILVLNGGIKPIQVRNVMSLAIVTVVMVAVLQWILSCIRHVIRE